MGKERFLRLTMERHSLRATAPLVSDKVAKTLIARNALYEKELSHVCKTVEKEKSHCKASFQKSKKDFIRSLDIKDQVDCANNNAVYVLEKHSSGSVFEAESRSRSSSLPTALSSRRAKLHLSRSSSLSIEKAKQESHFEQDYTSGYYEYTPRSPTVHSTQALQSPDSPIEMKFPQKSPPFCFEDIKDDVFDSKRRVFDTQSLGSSPTNSQISEFEQDIPEILVSEVDGNESEIPQRKTSLTKRSYSTGDLNNVLSESQKQISTPSSSPLLLRRVLSSCGNSDSRAEASWTEANDNKTKYGSLDESLFQRFNDMLMEVNVPQRPKPRPKPYTEEPFYLRKKCVIRRCLQNKTDYPVKPSSPQIKRRDQDGERPLAEILPPISLPPIYTQQNNRIKTNGMESEKNKNKQTGNKKTNAKIDVNDPRLTKNLNDCRYLRNQTKH